MSILGVIEVAHIFGHQITVATALAPARELEAISNFLHIHTEKVRSASLSQRAKKHIRRASLSMLPSAHEFLWSLHLPVGTYDRATSLQEALQV